MKPDRPAGRRPPALTSGPIVPALLRLAIPIVGANILQTVYQLTDTFWVGRLGATAVAAVSLSFPIIFLLVSLGGGLAVAGAILVAQYHGAGESGRVDHVAAQTLLGVVAVSLVLSVAGYLLTPPLVGLFAPGPAVRDQAVAYMRISFLGLVFQFAYFVFQSLLRGVGDVRTPLLVVLGTVLLNFVADPVFILGLGPVPAFGVAGAAAATVTTQALAAAIGLVLLFSGRYGVRLHVADLVPDPPFLRRVLALGLPASVEQSTRAAGLSVMMALVATFGTTTLAAYGIGGRMLSFVIIPALGLSMSTSTLVGQNIGAGSLRRAERTARVAAWIGFLVLSAVGALFFVIARPLTAAFIPGDAAVIASGAEFIRIMSPTFGLLGVQVVLTGAFRGSGNTVAAMLLAVLSLWILRFPLAWLLGDVARLGPTGLWWAFPVSNIASALIALGWFRRGRWHRAPLTDDEAMEGRVTRETLVEEGLG